MFTHNELQALLLGIQWVSQYSDAPLPKGATEALNKILHVLPTNIKIVPIYFLFELDPRYQALWLKKICRY